MIHLKPLSEQTIVITGASSGIGLAAAEQAVAQGARVVLAARNADALDVIAARLNTSAGRIVALAVPTDVGDQHAVEALCERAVEGFGGYDTWINDAAAATYGKLADLSLDDHHKVFETGYFGTVHGSLVAARHLRGRGGAIINVGSILSERAIMLQGPYSAMKHAVRGFTDALRVELMEDGAPISVTLIKPAAMNTPYPEHARNLMGRPGTLPPVVYDPRLSARAILFAAANPRREMTVGGTGRLIATAGVLFPSLTDAIMAAAGRAAQQTDQSPPPGRADNLHQPREDGAIESHQDVSVRRTSLYLEAQMRPLAATALISAVSALGAIALAGRRR